MISKEIPAKLTRGHDVIPRFLVISIVFLLFTAPFAALIIMLVLMLLMVQKQQLT